MPESTLSIHGNTVARFFMALPGKKRKRNVLPNWQYETGFEESIRPISVVIITKRLLERGLVPLSPADW